TMEIPPLRERPEDIPLLVEHLLRDEGHEGPVEQLFPDATMRVLARHTWPGNVRELRNVVAAAMALGEAPDVLGTAPPRAPAPASPPGDLLERPYREARRSVMDDFEIRYLKRLIERAGGNVREAARVGKMDRS